MDAFHLGSVLEQMALVRVWSLLEVYLLPAQSDQCTMASIGSTGTTKELNS